jgi:DNA polymerase-3 subunit alpha
MSGQGEVVATLKTGDEVPPQLRLGKDFALDGDLVEVIAGIEGVQVLSFAPQRGRAQLRLVA